MMTDPALLHLLHLCDPSLPIGSFSHSAGLETYVQMGKVNDKKSLKEFVLNQLSENIQFTDAAILSLTYDAACRNGLQKIIQLDDLCTALKAASEIRMSSNKLALRLLKIFAPAINNKAVDWYFKIIQDEVIAGHYCIAFALIAKALKISKEQALTGFYYNAATAFITNGVKLIPLGQQDGQQILMEMFEVIKVVAESSIFPDENLIGYCCNGFDISSMQHETLYTRLYMS